MFTLEYLVCKDKKHHKFCQWKSNGRKYPDSLFATAVDRLKKQTKKTGVAVHLIRNKKVLVTIKAQHINGDLYIQSLPYARLLYANTKRKISR
jgi:hypothetical protein